MSTKYWRNAVLCSVLKANRPYEVIEAFIKRIWKDYSIDKVAVIKKGFYLVRFQGYHDAMQVVQQGVYQFDHKPFIVKAWTPELEINSEAISTLPRWVQFPELDTKY